MTDIYHSGIKGQKKGVRRYQYLNGTYTREGNLRYRPPKAKSVQKAMILAEVGMVAAFEAKKKLAANASPSIIAAAKTALATIKANKIAIGKAIVETVLKVPSPVRAMVIPLMAAGAGLAIGKLVIDGADIVEKIKDVPWSKIANTTVSVGSSAAGIAISSITANPLPMVAGVTISTLMSIKEKEEK